MNSHLLAAAISGIVLGASTLAQAQTPMVGHFGVADVQQLDSSDGSKHACKGQNACKGLGGCKTDKNACKGQNSCKGQGGCRTDGTGPAPKEKNGCSGKDGCGGKEDGRICSRRFEGVALMTEIAQSTR
jgi:hypothetical protein